MPGAPSDEPWNAARLCGALTLTFHWDHSTEELLRGVGTLGELSDRLWQWVSSQDKKATVERRAAAFYALRRAIVEICGVSPRQLRPSARLDDVLGRWRRHGRWRRIRRRLGLKKGWTPDLEWPPGLSRVASTLWTSLMVFAAGLTLLALAALHFPVLRPWFPLPYWWNGGLTCVAWGVGLPLLLALVGLGGRLAAPLRTRVPEQIATVRRLVEHLDATTLRNAKWLTVELEWTPQLVWFLLRRRCAAEFKVPARSVRRGQPVRFELWQRRVCPVCEYDLRAATAGGECPECGFPLAGQRPPDWLVRAMAPEIRSRAKRLQYVRYKLVNGGPILAVGLLAGVWWWAARSSILAPIATCFGVLIGAGTLLERQWNRTYLWCRPPCPNCGQPMRCVRRWRSLGTLEAVDGGGSDELTSVTIGRERPLPWRVEFSVVCLPCRHRYDFVHAGSEPKPPPPVR